MILKNITQETEKSENNENLIDSHNEDDNDLP